MTDQRPGSGVDPGALVDPTARIHPTALIEAGVRIGPRSSVWDNVHIRHGAELGHDTSVGEKSYIAYDVRIGNYVKINAQVYICALVTVDDGVMISANTVFTNDLFPRALDHELAGLETSAVTDETLATNVRRGATIGAQATIGPGLTIGPYAMVGMGSVVTKDVPPHALVVGNPARLLGWVCACGPRVAGAGELAVADAATRWTCHRCGRQYGRLDIGPAGGVAPALSGLKLLHDPHAGRAVIAP